MGEGLDNDESIMPYIDAANIACGYHGPTKKISAEQKCINQQQKS